MEWGRAGRQDPAWLRATPARLGVCWCKKQIQRRLALQGLRKLPGEGGHSLRDEGVGDREGRGILVRPLSHSQGTGRGSPAEAELPNGSGRMEGRWRDAGRA